MRLSNLSLKRSFRRFFTFSCRPGSVFKSPSYLLKWVVVSTSIGIVAGMGAIAFYAAIHLATGFFLGAIVGYLPPNPAGEGTTHIMSLWAAVHPWLLPVVTTFGGLVTGILVASLAPEAEGGGQDAAIAAFHQSKSIPARIPFVKLLASAIIIGTGGSAGREGPVAQISAGFGSIIGRLFRLDTHDRCIALAVGIGAGIGAIFRAPLGGAILTVEILYRNDLEMEALIPALMASTIGYSIFGLCFGWSPIFVTPGNQAFTSPTQLLYYVLLGILCGLMGRLYARGFHGIMYVFRRLPLPNWINPAIGGLVVGMIGLAMPQILGTGYGWVQFSMGSGLLTLPLWVILLLPFAKILTTSLSIGSGGSGGIFGPGMVIGGMTGALFWRLSYHLLPGLPTLPAPFIIVGMMALFGGIAHAPIAMMLMVTEMTGNLSLLAPAMIAVSLAYLIVGRNTIFISQLDTRADSLMYRLQFSFPLLSILTVRQAMVKCVGSLRQTQSIAEAVAVFETHNMGGTPVVSEQGELLGTLTKADIERIPEPQRKQRTVAEAMNRCVQTLHPEETLDAALEQLIARQLNWAPVVELQRSTDRLRVVGVLTLSQIMQAYQQTKAQNLRR
jgi:chloride channel protein, CIC family